MTYDSAVSPNYLDSLASARTYLNKLNVDNLCGIVPE